MTLPGLMQENGLMISSLIRYAAEYHGETEIVTRTVEGPLHRYSYRDAERRAKRLAQALSRQLGVVPGDRISSLAWSTHRHFEMFYGISGTGAVLHTANPRLFEDQIAYVINHAGGRYLFLDVDFMPLVENLAPELRHVEGYVILTDRDHMPQSTLENVHCYEELLAVEDGDMNWPVFDERSAASLVMNAQHYTPEQLDCLLRLAERFARAGGNALIIGDPALVALIAGENFGLGLHVSSIAACRNGQAAAFSRDLGASRIIFPRDMTLKEMKRLMDALPDMQFEAFVLNDGCVFEEGVCHTIHLPGRLGGAICMDKYRYQYFRVDEVPLSDGETAALNHNDGRYDEWLWYRFGCGFSVTKDGYPFGPCGLCAMSRLRDMGVFSVKIAGRDAPLERKIRSVELVRKVLDEMALGKSGAKVAAFARGIRQTPDLCDHGQMCYYPEIIKTFRI